MELHERIRVLPVTARRMTTVDERDVHVGMVDQRVRESHTHCARAHDEVEAPTTRARRLFGGADRRCGARLEFVDEPGRRSERRRVERCGDAGSGVVELRGPSALRPQRRDFGDDLRVGDAPGFARDHHVEALRRDTDRAARVARNVLRLAGAFAGLEPASRVPEPPTLVTCGLPSAFRVVSQNVERFGERGSSCVRRSASCVSTWDHSIVASPSASPRFVAFMVLETAPLPETHRGRVRDSAEACWARSPIRVSPCSATSARRVAAARTSGSSRWDGSIRAGLRAQPLAQAAMSGSAP